MKNEIHPKWNKNVKVVCNDKVVAEVGSTMSELNVSIWSGNHPFYTGEQVFVDTENLIEKFNEKVKAAETTSKVAVSKREKRQKRTDKKKSVAASGPVTLKDMLKNLQ